MFCHYINNHFLDLKHFFSTTRFFTIFFSLVQERKFLYQEKKLQQENEKCLPLQQKFSWHQKTFLSEAT